jgi:hypothetical protein
MPTHNITSEESQMNGGQLDQLLSELGLDLVGGASSKKEGWKYYKLLSVNNKDIKNHTGHWGGKIPLQAAKKAFGRILKDNKAKTTDNYKAKFKIVEVKQGGDKKVFSYEGVNKKRSKPVIVNFGGNVKKTLTHETFVHKI